MLEDKLSISSFVTSSFATCTRNEDGSVMYQPAQGVHSVIKNAIGSRKLSGESGFAW